MEDATDNKTRGSGRDSLLDRSREGRKDDKEHEKAKAREKKERISIVANGARRGANRSRIIGCFAFNEETNHSTSLNFSIVGVVGMRPRAMPFSRSFGSLHFFYHLFSPLCPPLSVSLSLSIVAPPPPPPPATIVLTAAQKPSKNMSGRTKRGSSGERSQTPRQQRERPAAVKGQRKRGTMARGRRTMKRKMEPSTGHFLRPVRTDVRV